MSAFHSYRTAVQELLSRIEDGKELIAAGKYSVSEAWKMACLQAERVKNAAPQVPGSSASTGTDGEGAVSPVSGEPLSQKHLLDKPAAAAPIYTTKAIDSDHWTKSANAELDRIVERLSAYRTLQHNCDYWQELAENLGGLDAAVKRLDGPKSEWISVNDRLPQAENERCLIAHEEVIYGVLPWKLDQHGNGAGWMDLFEGVLYGPKDVTHWMPVSPPCATNEKTS